MKLPHACGMHHTFMRPRLSAAHLAPFFLGGPALAGRPFVGYTQHSTHVPVSPARCLQSCLGVVTRAEARHPQRCAQCMSSR